MPNEIRHKTRGRAVVQGVGIVPLVQAPFRHDTNHIPNGKCFHLVVRDKQSGGVGLFQNAAHFQGQPLAQLDIQIRKRLIQQQQLGRRRQRASQGHALLLAPGQLMRIALRTGGQTHELQHLAHTLLLFAARLAVQTKTHVVLHRQMRKQRVILKHHANAT